MFEEKDYVILSTNETQDNPRLIKNLVNLRKMCFVLLSKEHEYIYINSGLFKRLTNFILPEKMIRKLNLRKIGLFESDYISLWYCPVPLEDFRKHIEKILDFQSFWKPPAGYTRIN